VDWRTEIVSEAAAVATASWVTQAEITSKAALVTTASMVRLTVFKIR
jgi:hypothetical protein